MTRLPDLSRLWLPLCGTGESDREEHHVFSKLDDTKPLMFGLLKPKSRKPLRREPLAREGRVLHVAGRDIPLTIREHEQATRITLRIEPGGKALKMTIPRGLSRREADDFLARHHGWLVNRLSRIPSAESLAARASVPIRGVEHDIRFSGKLRGLTEATMDNGQPVLMLNGLPEHAGRRITDFLKKEARKDLEARVAHHAATIGKSVASLTLKDTTSRWGSCSTAGNLNFSWRIVMAPDFVIDYLAAHEVAHLKEMNHGPRFWSLCRKLCPRTEEARAWLKHHGNRLHAMDFATANFAAEGK